MLCCATPGSTVGHASLLLLNGRAAYSRLGSVGEEDGELCRLVHHAHLGAIRHVLHARERPGNDGVNGGEVLDEAPHRVARAPVVVLGEGDVEVLARVDGCNVASPAKPQRDFWVGADARACTMHVPT